jgi:hypothetical protein
MSDARAFRGFRFPAEVILWAVRWCLQFGISYRDLEAMLADRGMAVDHVSLYRGVQRFWTRPTSGSAGNGATSTGRSTVPARPSAFCSAPSATSKQPSASSAAP